MRPVLDSIRRTISSSCSKNHLSPSGPFSALRDVSGKPLAFMSIAVHAQKGRFGAMLSLARLFAASMAFMWYHSSLGRCRCFAFFLDIFTADARDTVLRPIFFVPNACCDPLGDGAIFLPLTFCVGKLGVDVFVISFIYQLY